MNSKRSSKAKEVSPITSLPPKVRAQVGLKKTTYLARVRKNGQTDTATFDTPERAAKWIQEQENKLFTGVLNCIQ